MKLHSLLLLLLLLAAKKVGGGTPEELRDFRFALLVAKEHWRIPWRMNMHPNYGESEGDNGFDARKKAICGETLKGVQYNQVVGRQHIRQGISSRMKLELLQWQKSAIFSTVTYVVL
jgi:hypothetical protein